MGTNSYRNYGIIFLISIFNLLGFSITNAQEVLENKTLDKNIKTVLCFNSAKEQSFPMIQLGANDFLKIAFDDLDGGIKNYFYSIEHCTKDWKSSELQSLYYVQNFNQDRINTYEYSQNTTQKFTHYSFNLPNQQVSPKISGNYILKVFKDNDPDQLVFQQRFYVVDSKITVDLQMTTSPTVKNRASHQKINITLNTGNTPIQNPYQDLSVLVLQNMRPDIQIWNKVPRNIAMNKISYDAVTTNDFFGGNEFRKFDIRSLRNMGIGVNNIEKEGDTLIMVQLSQDQLRAGLPYSQFFDDNGRYFVRFNDRSNANNNLESDYADVFFTLKAEKSDNGGDVYVVGQFNNYQYSPNNKMFYDESNKTYYMKAKLKQGVYDYEYAYVDPKGTKSDVDTEGSFFDTSNEYQALVYFRRPSSRYDELLGYGNINTDTSKGRNL